MTTAAAARPLPSFDALRYLANTNAVAAACIEMRKAEVCATSWDIVPDSALTLMRRWDPLWGGYRERRKAAVEFFRRPDPDYGDFASWLRAAMNQVLVNDALAVYLAPDHTGALTGLLLLDGSCIEPALDHLGCCTGFREYGHPVPRRTCAEIITAPWPDPVQEYRPNEIMYLPFTFRTDTPFGRSPLERAMELAAGADPENPAPEVTTGHLLEAFELPGRMFGIHLKAGAIPVPEPDPAVWRRRCLRWLAGQFDQILGTTGLQWKWDTR